MRRIVLLTVLIPLGLTLVSTGCSVTGAAMTGLRVGKNLSQKDSHLAITLDGHRAAQDKVKKAATGYSRFTVGETVSTAPTLQFQIEEPDRFGRITMVQCQIHQKFEADYSHQAEFVIFSNDVNNPEAQMKPNTPYNLGAPGAAFKVMNYRNEPVGGVTLKPGMDYMLVLTVKADHSESAQVYFSTK